MSYNINEGEVRVTIVTCMGKSHYMTISHFTKAYGDTGDRLLFVDSADLSPFLTREERQNSIVPNTVIPSLLKSESCCQLIVECANCKEAVLRWEFTPKYHVHDDYSIDYNEMSLYITPKGEDKSV